MVVVGGAGHGRGRSKQPLRAPLPLWMDNLGRGLGAKILGQRKEGLGPWIPGSEGEGDGRPMRWDRVGTV